MPRPDLIELLIAHTGDLQPGSETTHAELTDLRRALLESTHGEGAPAAHAAADDSLHAELRYLVAQHIANEAQPGAVRVVRRESPVATGDPSVPGWAIAFSPSRTFGPFVDGTGRSVWFDVFPVSQRLGVRRGEQGPDFLLLPFTTLRRLRRAAARLNLNLPAGTVWIAARQLSAAAPAGSYAGVRIRGGSLGVDGPAHFSGDRLVLEAGATVTLRITLDPPSAADGPDTGPGSEAAHADAVLPATASFVFTPGGAREIETADASLSVYGSEFSLRRNRRPPVYDAILRQVLIPMAPTPGRLDIGETQSELFTPSGAARIARAAWGLPVAETTPGALGEAAGAGFLVLSVADGLHATWQGLAGGPVSITRADILVDGISLQLLAHQAAGFRSSQSFQLWQEASGARSSLEIAFRKEFRLWFFSFRAALDSILATGTALAHLDRPLTAAGRRVDNPIEAAWSLLHRPGRVDLFVGSTEPPENARGPVALALTNALLTTTLPLRLSLSGPLAAPGRMDSGTLNLFFGLYQVLPTLPDPYAASFLPRLTNDAPDGTVQVRAQVAWPEPAAPKLAIDFSPAPAGLHSALMPEPAETREQHELFGSFSSWLGDVRAGGLALLDVSSNADQLGVSFGLAHRAAPVPLKIEDLALATPGGNARVFLLPQFQWEPVRNLPNELTLDKAGELVSESDGGPTQIGARSVRLVPVAPIPVAAEVVRAWRDDRAHAAALFTLPFGLQAVALLNPLDRRYLIAPELRLLRAAFDGLSGARALSLRSGLLAGPGLGAVTIAEPRIDGAATQTQNLSPSAENPQLHSVLGPVLEPAFNATFQEEVPLQRIDFTGHGANVFSRWANVSKQANQITQVAFDAFHGRTAHERVQLTCILFPCEATLVRTVTLERYGSGAVVRWDSGWTATTPGLFHHAKVPGVVFHPGVVRGMYDIREIRDTDHIVKLSGGASAQAVYYDADVEIDGVRRGQGSNGRVPARRQLGFVQFISLDSQVTQGGVAALTAAQLKELFEREGPLGGPIDCTIRVGVSRQEMRVTGVYANNAGGSPPRFAVAAEGNLALPASGQWSVVRVRNATGAVEPLQAQRGVPLIRRGEATAGASANPFRWADPADLFANAPDTDYALLFASDTQRILYARPKVEAADANITSVLEPRLADPYMMLRSGGLFPRPADAVPFDKPYPLSVASGLLQFVPAKVSFSAPPNLERQLVNASTWTADALYDAAGFVVDSAGGWNIDVEGLSQRLRFEPLGEILRIVHDIHSPAAGATDFPDPAIHFSGLLAPVAEIFDLLKRMVPVPAEDLPGLPGPLHVSASFEGTTFRLAAVADFKLEGEDGQGIDCGVGKLRGELQVGAELTAEILAGRIGGAVFLEITGSYQQLILPLIYGGGLLRFKIRADETGRTTVELDACTCGSVGGTIIPGLIDLEASVKYGYFVAFEIGSTAFQPGIVLGLEGRAKLLSGLLGFSLAVEGRLILERIIPDEIAVRLRGDILVAGTVTAAWLIKKRKSFHTSYNVKVDWKLALAAAKAGLLPVP